MSKYGPENVRTKVQPLLDAIAPECATNLLELSANAAARAQDPSIKPIPAIGWQDGFFDKKIYEPLQLEVLSLNGAWEDEATDQQKVADILAYFKNQHTGVTSSLGETVDALFRHAKEYLNQIHVNARKHIDNPQDLDHFEAKALFAFFRMANMVLAYHAKALLAGFKETNYPLLNEHLAKAGLDTCSFQQRNHFMGILDAFIDQNAAFTDQELRQLRYHKAKTQSRYRDHRGYFGGSAFDGAKSALENWQQLSYWQRGASLCRYAMFGALVKLQQKAVSTIWNFRQALLEEDLQHFQQAVLAKGPADTILTTLIELPALAKQLSQPELQMLFIEIAQQRIEVCQKQLGISPTGQMCVDIDYEKLIGQPRYLPSSTDFDQEEKALEQAMRCLTLGTEKKLH